MTHRIFVASRSYAKYSPETVQFLKENNYTLDFNQQDQVYRKKDLLEIVEGYDILVVGVDEVTEKVIKKGKRLKVIAKNGVGLDNMI